MASSSTPCSDDPERLRTLEQYRQKKMASDLSGLHLKPIKTKPEKLPSQALSRDTSVNSSSSEYYAASPIAIPFRWESQPGTPKARYRESLTPALTPPPSSTKSPARKHVKKQPKSTTLLQNVLSFAKRSPRKAPPQHFEPRTLSPSSQHKATSRVDRRESSCIYEARADSDDYESASSILCFSVGRRLNVGSSCSSPLTPPPSSTRTHAQKLDFLKTLPKR